MFANIVISRGFDKPSVFSHESRLEPRLALLERHFYAFLRSQRGYKVPPATPSEAPAWLDDHDQSTDIHIHTKNAAFTTKTEEGFSAAEIETVKTSMLAALQESLTDFRIVEQESSLEPNRVETSLIVVGAHDNHVDVEEIGSAEKLCGRVESVNTAKALPKTAEELRKDRQENIQILEDTLVTPATDLQASASPIKGGDPTIF